MILPTPTSPSYFGKKNGVKFPQMIFNETLPAPARPSGGASWHHISSREAFDPEADAKDLRWVNWKGFFVERKTQRCKIRNTREHYTQSICIYKKVRIPNTYIHTYISYMTREKKKKNKILRLNPLNSCLRKTSEFSHLFGDDFICPKRKS